MPRTNAPDTRRATRALADARDSHALAGRALRSFDFDRALAAVRDAQEALARAVAAIEAEMGAQIVLPVA